VRAPVAVEFEPLVSRWLREHKFRGFGSVALHLAFAALGAVDLVLDHKAALWDLAAGAAVLAEAERLAPPYVTQFRERRDAILPALRAQGFSPATPRATMYVWVPLPDGVTDEALERRLYPPSAITAKESRPRPDWAAIHRELRRPGVTLQLLWEEHRAAYPDGYGYSRFCELYRAFEARLSPTMRQTHVAGERLFVDYAGTTLAVIDTSTGAAMPAQLFVAALGASNYTYAEATWTQGLADWIGSHTRAFAFLGAVLWIYKWYKPEGPVSEDELVREMQNVFFGGIAPQAESGKPRPKPKSSKR